MRVIKAADLEKLTKLIGICGMALQTEVAVKVKGITIGYINISKLMRKEKDCFVHDPREEGAQEVKNNLHNFFGVKKMSERPKVLREGDLKIGEVVQGYIRFER